MRKEQIALFISAIINIIVSVLKIVGGILSGCYTLIASGYYTICDLSTDVLAIVGGQVGKRRANKKHPFGYGRYEYILQIFIGSVIFLVGFYVFIRSFFIEYNGSNLKILLLILLLFFLKVLSSNYLMQKGKDISSLILVVSAKESFLDVLSLIITFLIVLISQFLPFIDIVGCLLMASLLIYEGLKIIFDNIILIIGIDDNNLKIKNKLKEIVNKEKNVKYSDSFLIKNREYYQATIEIAIMNSVTIQDLIKIEYKLRNKIRKSNINVKFIDFNIIKM